MRFRLFQDDEQLRGPSPRSHDVHAPACRAHCLREDARAAAAEPSPAGPWVALQQSEARLQSVLDQMMEGCQLIGFDWRYLYVNESVTRQGAARPTRCSGTR